MTMPNEQSEELNELRKDMHHTIAYKGDAVISGGLTTVGSNGLTSVTAQKMYSAAPATAKGRKGYAWTTETLMVMVDQVPSPITKNICVCMDCGAEIRDAEEYRRLHTQFHDGVDKVAGQAQFAEDQSYAARQKAALLEMDLQKVQNPPPPEPPTAKVKRIPRPVKTKEN